jgi:hypothetical protein
MTKNGQNFQNENFSEKWCLGQFIPFNALKLYAKYEKNLMSQY